jgi:prepilin-type N-terminal cleavage/methylation domain-containing protein
MTGRRAGVTLLEVIVVVAILALLIGLVLSAVQVAREAAVKSQSQNNLRQIALACHSYAAAHNGRLPADDDQSSGFKTVFLKLLGHTDAHGTKHYQSYIRLFMSPADPTLDGTENKDTAPCSYAYNWQVFDPKRYPDYPKSFPDGTANTLLFAEHYARCDFANFSWTSSGYPNMGNIGRGPAFAMYPPVTSGNPPVTMGSEGMEHLTFQTRPCTMYRQFHWDRPPDCGRQLYCDPSLAQTPHRGGMLTALADGCVRTLAPNIAPQIYWGAVTPAGGEVLSDW